MISDSNIVSPNYLNHYDKPKFSKTSFPSPNQPDIASNKKTKLVNGSIFGTESMNSKDQHMMDTNPTFTSTADNIATTTTPTATTTTTMLNFSNSIENSHSVPEIFEDQIKPAFIAPEKRRDSWRDLNRKDIDLLSSDEEELIVSQQMNKSRRRIILSSSDESDGISIVGFLFWGLSLCIFLK